MYRSIPFALVASALALSGCSQLDTGASEPDKATQLMMEACGIEAAEGGDGAGLATGYEYGGFAGMEYKPVGDDLDTVVNRSAQWRERAIASRAASRLDRQWSDLANAFRENSNVETRIATFRLNDESPGIVTQREREVYGIFGARSDEARAYNANLDFIDIECGALMRTLD